MKKVKHLFAILTLSTLVLSTYAQDLKLQVKELQQRVHTLDSISNLNQKQVEKNSIKLDKLAVDFGKWGKISMGGYVQAQWQLAEDVYAPAFADAGAFPFQSNNRFMIRRGRIKFVYNVGPATIVFQPDFNEKGVGIKDVYLKLTSNNKIWSGQVGMFDRPFGYEISYSSSKRESVERSYLFLSLFPGERDLGAMATISLGDFVINGGLFNGTGIAKEDDSRKDFIGRVAWSKDLCKNFELGAALSYYNGSVLTGAIKHYEYEGEGFKELENERYTTYLREYIGVGAKVLTDFGIGETNIRGEYVWGKQPGSFKNNNSLTGGHYNTSPGEPVYLRNFYGWYTIYAQTIGKSKHQLVFKYDYYDPNTEMEGDKAGHYENTGAADLAYSTFGVGYNFQATKNIKLSAYYDFVDNETTTFPIDQYIDYSKRIKQNVLTLRLQVKF